MSLVQFDEVYEICCEMAGGKAAKNAKPVMAVKDDDYHWWEQVVQEVQEVIHKEEEEEVLVMS